MDLFEYLSESREQKRRTTKAKRDQRRDFVKRRWLELLTLVLAIAGVICVVETFTAKHTETSGSFFSQHTTTTGASFGTRLLYLVVGIVCIAGAVYCGRALMQRARRRAAEKSYLVILTGVESIRVQEIAAKTNQDRATVLRDIQGMIDDGALDDFYIDHSADRVISKKYVPKSGQKTVLTCAACGTNNEAIVGIAKSCAGCGEPLLAT